MKIIHHRRNTTALLASTEPAHGVEVDIRSQGTNLIIHHEPYAEGELFDEWFESYRHDTLILNVKEEGLEQVLLEKLAYRKFENFFFLDQSIPFLLKTKKNGESRCAIRVSEYEPVSLAERFAGLVDWVWVDCFARFPLTIDDYETLKSSGFNLCLVSPELQGRATAEIAELRRFLDQESMAMDAVCTKVPFEWL